MKKIIFLLVVFAAFVSCTDSILDVKPDQTETTEPDPGTEPGSNPREGLEGGWMWDFTCYTVGVNVKSADDDLSDNGITLRFRNKTYELGDTKGRPETRFLLPDWMGFRAYENILLFGEFSPTECIVREELVIDWGDGTTDTLWFTCDVKEVSSENPVVTLNLWLKTAAAPDGELVDDDGLTVKIIKN